MDIKLAYKTGALTHALFVILDGVLTFSNCLFSSGSNDSKYPLYVSIYIADVKNNGKLIIEEGSISQITMESYHLIHGYDESLIEIRVCLFTYFFLHLILIFDLGNNF
jgi:hypothetical protein